MPRTIVRLLSATAALAGIAVAQSPSPNPNPEGHVTQIYNDVQLVPGQAQARTATLNDKVDENTALKTGDNSRSELTFADLTITRLGANTVFSFNKAGRSIRLDSGAILVYVKKNSGGAELSTKAVTVGVTGTTFIVDSSAQNGDSLVVLEGVAQMTLVDHPDQTSTVQGGQRLRVPTRATKMPKPINVRVEDFLKSYPLLVDFPPLPSQDIMMAVAQGQNAAVTPEANPRAAKKREPSRPMPTPNQPVSQTGPSVWSSYPSGSLTRPPPPPKGNNPPGTHNPKPTPKPTPTPTPKKKKKHPGSNVG